MQNPFTSIGWMAAQAAGCEGLVYRVTYRRPSGEVDFGRARVAATTLVEVRALAPGVPRTGGTVTLADGWVAEVEEVTAARMIAELESPPELAGANEVAVTKAFNERRR